MKYIFLFLALLAISAFAQERIVIDPQANHVVIDDSQMPLDSLSLDYFKNQTGEGKLQRIVIDVKNNEVIREWEKNGMFGILTKQNYIDSRTRIYLDTKFKVVNK